MIFFEKKLNLLFELVVVTHQYSLVVFLMQMHCPAETILKDLAISALTRLHPLAVAERLETIFPDIEKIVVVDVALHKATVDVGASGNGAVHKNGADGDTRTAEIEPVAHLALVRTDVGLATELAIDFAFLSGRNDEVHQLAELFIAELQALVSGSTANRVDGEQTPRQLRPRHASHRLDCQREASAHIRHCDLRQPDEFRRVGGRQAVAY